MNKIQQTCKNSASLTLVLSLTCSSLFHDALSADNPVPNVHRVKLTNTALKFIDGVPYGIDAKAIQDMLNIRKKVREMQFGVFDKKMNVYIGRYTLAGKKHCLKTLVPLEQQYEEEFKRKKDDLHKKHLNSATFRHAWVLYEARMEEELEEKLLEQEAISHRRHSNDELRLLEAKRLKRKVRRQYEEKLQEEREALQRKHMENPAVYDKELQVLKTEYTKKMAPLKLILEEVKKELMDITEPFLEQARSAKEFLMPLMEEWAEKAGRPFSPLLRWHEEDNGSEVEMFKRDVHSFYRVDRFCTDLVDFNESIVYSCPRGYKQFMELLSSLKQNA